LGLGGRSIKLHLENPPTGSKSPKKNPAENFAKARRKKASKEKWPKTVEKERIQRAKFEGRRGGGGGGQNNTSLEKKVTKRGV